MIMRELKKESMIDNTERLLFEIWQEIKAIRNEMKQEQKKEEIKTLTSKGGGKK